MVDIDFTFVIALVLFGIVFLLLRSLVFKPVLRVIDERHAQTEGAVAGAKKMESEADAMAKKVARELQNARFEASAERERMRLAAKKREQEILKQAREDANRAADEARHRIAAERKAAEAAIPGTGRDLAKVVVERVAGRAL